MKFRAIVEREPEQRVLWGVTFDLPAEKIELWHGDFLPDRHDVHVITRINLPPGYDSGRRYSETVIQNETDTDLDSLPRFDDGIRQADVKVQRRRLRFLGWKTLETIGITISPDNLGD